MVHQVDIARIRKPRVTDVAAMKALIDSEVARGMLLPRTTVELYASLREFHIYADDDGIGGCCALHRRAGGSPAAAGAGVVASRQGSGGRVDQE